MDREDANTTQREKGEMTKRSKETPEKQRRRARLRQNFPS
jgi:hypothetical protein